MRLISFHVTYNLLYVTKVIEVNQVKMLKLEVYVQHAHYLPVNLCLCVIYFNLVKPIAQNANVQTKVEKIILKSPWKIIK